MTMETHNGQRQFVLPKAQAESMSPSPKVGFVPKRPQRAPKPSLQDYSSPITRENMLKSRSSAPISFEAALTALSTSTSSEHTPSAHPFPTDGLSLQRPSGLEGFNRPALVVDNVAQSLAQDPASSMPADVGASTSANSTLFRRANKQFVPYAAPQANALQTPAQLTTIPLGPSLHPGSVARNFLTTPKIAASDIKHDRVLNLIPPSRSVTPALGQQEIDNHGPVDYAVFHSLMVAQSKKEKLLRQKVSG